MTSNEVGMQLHNRATLGEALTVEEQLQLDNWYAVQDAKESELLQLDSALPNVSQLRQQIVNTLSQKFLVMRI